MRTLFYKIPPHLPFPKGVPRFAGFGKWFDETHHPELVEGEGPACLREALRRRPGEILQCMSIQF
jgi:hypothetical protein